MPLYNRHFFVEDSYMGKGIVESTFTRGSAFYPPVEIIPPSLGPRRLPLQVSCHHLSLPTSFYLFLAVSRQSANRHR